MRSRRALARKCRMPRCGEPHHELGRSRAMPLTRICKQDLSRHSGHSSNQSISGHISTPMHDNPYGMTTPVLGFFAHGPPHQGERPELTPPPHATTAAADTQNVLLPTPPSTTSDCPTT